MKPGRDRFLEITSGPASCAGCRRRNHQLSTYQSALDLDALLGGLRPVLKGLDADKINTISSAVIELLQGQAEPCRTCWLTPARSRRRWGNGISSSVTRSPTSTRYWDIDQKSAQFSASVDQLQQLITALAKNKDSIAGAIPPLASTTADLTELLQSSRRPLQGVLENTRPLATELDNRKAEVNNDIEQLGEDYLRLSALGAYGSFFNIYFCAVTIKINDRPAATFCCQSWTGGFKQGQVRFCQINEGIQINEGSK